MNFSEKMKSIDDALQLGMETIEALADENRLLSEQLEKCAWRNRYDGDLFHDQGIEARMEASWKEYSAAMQLLTETGYLPSRAQPTPSKQEKM